MLSSCTWATDCDCCATWTCSSVAASRARSMSRWASAASSACGAISLRSWQLLLARVVLLGLDELGPDLGELGARGDELGPRQPELRLRLGVVEPGEDRALVDPLALLDQHLGDLAGDLRGDGGLAPRGDVAAGVEHRAGPRALAGRARDRRLHHRRPGAEDAEPEPAAQEEPGRGEDDVETGASARRAVRPAVDPQLVEEV